MSLAIFSISCQQPAGEFLVLSLLPVHLAKVNHLSKVNHHYSYIKCRHQTLKQSHLALEIVCLIKRIIHYLSLPYSWGYKSWERPIKEVLLPHWRVQLAKGYPGKDSPVQLVETSCLWRYSFCLYLEDRGPFAYRGFMRSPCL